VSVCLIKIMLLLSTSRPIKEPSPTVSVRLNPVRHENNRSSFGAFGGRTRAGFTVKTDVPPRAVSTEPAGRTLPTPGLFSDVEMLQEIALYKLTVDIDEAPVYLCIQLKKIKELPPLDHMTQEMYYDYFPEVMYADKMRPTLWPHTRSYQPENDPNTIP